MTGTAAFAATHPIQRAWRDIHFASMHVSLNPEQNFAHFGRTELGLPRDSHQPSFEGRSSRGLIEQAHGFKEVGVNKKSYA